jgi:hypothetical protein
VGRVSICDRASAHHRDHPGHERRGLVVVDHGLLAHDGEDHARQHRPAGVYGIDNVLRRRLVGEEAPQFHVGRPIDDEPEVRTVRQRRRDDHGLFERRAGLSLAGDQDDGAERSAAGAALVTPATRATRTANDRMKRCKLFTGTSIRMVPYRRRR